MEQLSSHFFKMDNYIFRYGLTATQFTVYSYLVCLGGQRGICWPSVGAIADKCQMSATTTRKVISELEELRFIKKVQTKQTNENGRTRQGNNVYYILDKPPVPVVSPAGVSVPSEFREVEAEGGGSDEVL